MLRVYFEWFASVYFYERDVNVLEVHSVGKHHVVKSFQDSTVRLVGAFGVI